MADGLYSTVPAVLDGLYESLRAWPVFATDEELVIRPAPTVSADAARKAIVVGWNGDAEDFTSVEFDIAPEGLGGNRDREDYTVRLVAEVLADDGEMTTAVAEVYALVQELARLVYAARGPNGASIQIGTAPLLRAKLGGGTLATQLDQNPRATVAVGLVVSAFTGSAED